MVRQFQQRCRPLSYVAADYENDYNLKKNKDFMSKLKEHFWTSNIFWTSTDKTRYNTIFLYKENCK
jgi:hypothetical protein